MSRRGGLPRPFRPRGFVWIRQEPLQDTRGRGGTAAAAAAAVAVLLVDVGALARNSVLRPTSRDWGAWINVSES